MAVGIAAQAQKSQEAAAQPKDAYAGSRPAGIRFGFALLGSPRRKQNNNKEKRHRPRCVLTALLGACALLGSAGVAKSEQEKSRPQRPPVTAERYEIEVSFQPEKSFLHARAGVTLRADAPLDAIECELNPHLQILEVTNGQGRKLEFERSGRLGSPKLSVRLAEPVGTRQDITLTFTYEGALPVRSLDYITKGGILLRDESRWYPAVDLAAFTETEISVHLPKGWLAFSNGHSREITQAGYVQLPVSSRSVAAIPPGHSCEQPKRPARVIAGHAFSAWACVGQDQASRISSLERAIEDIMSSYAERVPLRRNLALKVVQAFPGQRGATGYSAPGFLAVSEDVVKFFDYPGYAPEFLPHEIAHQWFPIEVTLASQEDGWLAESLAEYLAWRYLEATDPVQARRMVAWAMRDALAPEPLPRLGLGLRLFALENWEATHATLYQRGSLVWRTLETVIDRERVDLALREYYRRYAGRSASIADFRRICEEISGRNLGWFFDYFLNGTRIPEIEFRRTPATAPNEVAGEIILKNVPPDFQVRVELRLETTAGPIGHSVATRGEVTPFTVTSKDPVTRIAVDPDLRILRWTDAAQRNRSQRPLLATVGELESKDELARAADACQKALALDPENLARNEQQIRFELGRLYYRMEQYARASQQFARVLELGSLDPMGTDFHRAWARVYRARIEKLGGHPAAARAEAQAGLAMKSPALETSVALREAHGRAATAAAELRALAQ